MKKLIVVVVLALSLASCTRVTGDGEKVGSVIKLSQEGFICKTWEGELIRGGMANGSGGFSTTPLHFTVNDPQLLVQVKDALEHQYEVKVRYAKYAGPFPCESGNGDDLFLTSIQRLNN